MEGVTGYVYRNAYAKYYGGIVRYFTPFVANKSLDTGRKMTSARNTMREWRSFRRYLRTAQKIFWRSQRFCGSMGTIRSTEPRLPVGHSGGKRARRRIPCDAGRAGSFFWKRFLKNVRSGSPSRHGSEKRTLQNGSGCLPYMKKYPLEELIVHPRVQTDFYKNRVNLGGICTGREKQQTFALL